MNHFLRLSVIPQGKTLVRGEKLRADDVDAIRGNETDPHPAGSHVQDFQSDVAADTDLLAGFSAEDEHDESPP
jgi:hypothetical protein